MTAIALLLLSAAVIWGCIVDHLRNLDEHHNRNHDDADHHRALLKELRRHDDEQVRWRP
jgi:hypothetical protein